MDLLDRYLPGGHLLSRHRARVEAGPDEVWQGLQDLDFHSSPILRILFTLRGMPSIRRLADFGELGFRMLIEDPPRHLVLGLIGRLWTLRGGLADFDPPAFRAFDRPGYAKTAWGFEVIGEEGGPSTVATETRVRCTDSSSQRRFRRYWVVVGPFSSVIRREMLRLLRRHTEKQRRT